MSTDTKVVAHTPGPWEVEYVVDGAFVVRAAVNDDTVMIATRNPIKGRHMEFVANACLIAAAPRMYERIAKLARSGDDEAIAIMEAVNGGR